MQVCQNSFSSDSSGDFSSDQTTADRSRYGFATAFNRQANSLVGGGELSTQQLRLPLLPGAELCLAAPPLPAGSQHRHYTAGGPGL